MRIRTLLQFWACLFISLLLASNQAISQQDSTSVAYLDSIVEQQEETAIQLVEERDSVLRQDSLHERALLTRLEEEGENSVIRRITNAKLDSMDRVRQLHAIEYSQRIDSLRASAVGYPVIFHSDTLFQIYTRLGPYRPRDRAENIRQRLRRLNVENLYDANQLIVENGPESSDIIHGDNIILGINAQDAFWTNQSRQETAEEYLLIIKESIESYNQRTGLLQLALRIGLLFIVILIFYFGIRFMSKTLDWLIVKFRRKSKPYIKAVTLRNYEFLSKARAEQLVEWTLTTFKWAVIVLFVYLALPVLFSIFPATKGIATTLIGYVTYPLRQFFSAVIGYIPELFTIIIIIALTRYFLKVLRFFTLEIEAGRLQLSGFYPEWAKPSFNLVKIIIYAFAFIIIFPYLPGSDSPVFKGVSVFFGLLISLGSTSAISNIVAGLVITYMRAFKVGDRVRIGETVGDVTEKTLLVTRVRTIKNEEVTIPNSAILAGSTINYSASARDMGLILNTTVTIGYDVPWRQVHELLINAALDTNYVQKQPKPFVLQTSLDDFYVSYQLNAYSSEVQMAARIYAELHSKIQDHFREADVEIMSPHYRANRDGPTTVPKE